MSGTADNNIDFADLCRFLESLGFEERVQGDHHIFSRVGLAEIVTNQPIRNRAKAFEVAQARKLIRRHEL